ncbi:uncharacterized protein [Amphiura filiformis]|uniref:uncharacterized protein n=1 Tax=Amphiura filiformis TaxID=82378 RepID=UPI003B2201BA
MPLCRFGTTSWRGFRIMASKRAVASILATVGFMLGIYLAFFNHPPATETLEINLHKGAHEESKRIEPHFRHLRFREDSAKSSAIRALNVSDNSVSQQLVRIFKVTNSTTQDPFGESSIINAHQADDRGGEVKVQHPSDERGVVEMQEKVQVEQNEMESGQNAREDKLTEDKEVEVEKANSIDMDRNIGRSKEYGPHHIRIFDWDKWVQQNNFIDIGTIWAYCDDPDPPPPVGKVMMKKDEEYGSGLKIVIHMNSTFEENIEFGKIALSVDVNGMHFFSKKYDACAMVTQSEFFRCPMLAGDKYFHIEQHVPIFLPTGDYYVESQLIDQFDRTIVCAQVKMTL